MAVTAAPTRKEPGCVDVELGEIYGQVLAGIEINLLSMNRTSVSRQTSEAHLRSVNGNYVLIAANHVQARACGRLDGSRIVTKLFDFSFQRLIDIAKRFDVALHN